MPQPTQNGMLSGDVIVYAFAALPKNVVAILIVVTAATAKPRTRTEICLEKIATTNRLSNPATYKIVITQIG